MALDLSQLHGDAYKRELERKMHDTIKLHNPTHEDFTVFWDGYGHTLKALSDGFFPRYIAQHLQQHLIDQILTREEDQRIEAINKVRMKKGQPKLTSNEREMEEKKTNDLNRRRPWVQQIWKGVESEFGLDEVPQRRELKPQDMRPADQILIEEIEALTPPSLSQELNAADKEELVAGVAE